MLSYAVLLFVLRFSVSCGVVVTDVVGCVEVVGDGGDGVYVCIAIVVVVTAYVVGVGVCYVCGATGYVGFAVCGCVVIIVAFDCCVLCG